MSFKWHSAIVVLFQLFTATLIFFGQQIETSPNGGPSIDILNAIFKASGTMIHINIALLMLLNCRSYTWLSRKAFGRSVDASRSAFVSTTGFAAIHTVTHLAVAEIWFAKTEPSRNTATLALATIQLGVSWSGFLLSMLLWPALIIIIMSDRNRIHTYTAKRCLKGLGMIFLAILATHEAFCVMDWSSKTFLEGRDTLWIFWLAGGLILLAEGIALALRPQRKARVLKIDQHLNGVFEIRFEKLGLRPGAGQSINLYCPRVSVIRKHQLPLTSAPEDDYLSVHIALSHNSSDSLAKSLCSPTITKYPQGLPCFYLDGFSGVGSAAVFNAQVAILVASGYGILPMVSILRSVLYRMASPRKATMLHTVYFFWICEDLESVKWFQALLMAIEGENLRIEIYLYLTGPFDEAKATKHLINSAVHRIDLLTGLRNPIRHGDPDWRQIFDDIAQYHEETKPNTHVLYSGPQNSTALELSIQSSLPRNELGPVGFSKIGA